MFFYVLPGTGIYGGVKKGFHCADLLSASGHRCAVATPDGTRPDWFDSQCEVISHDTLVSRCTDADHILFSCPADAPFVDALPAHAKTVHMQGANTPDDHALFSSARGYRFISHGLHMTYELQRHGRVAPLVPMGIPSAFRWRGESKQPGRIAVLPRKGGDILRAIAHRLPPSCELIEIDGLSERATAACLKSADIFVAISTCEAFGLPPLEAMCAGCCVIGFPGDGGFEFMRHLDTAYVVPNGDVSGLVEAVTTVMASPTLREALRARGLAFSGHYTLDRERDALLRALGLDNAA
jgi:glycosyltransferase involved in cell wall biosynthesis